MSTVVGCHGEYDPAVVVSGAIGPYAAVCGGTVGNGASGNGYVTGLKLAVGIASAVGLDEGTCRIVSGDRCRVAGAYIGQTNFLIATSYTGLNGVIWGLDVVAEPSISHNVPQPLFLQNQPEGPPIPVLPIEPLLQASRQLLGTRESRDGQMREQRYPPLPGLQLVAAYKSGAGYGPGWVWSVLELAVLVDRSTGSSLFNEDGGMFGDAQTKEADVRSFLQQTLDRVGNSIVACGQNHNVRYGRIFAGAKALYVPEGYYGCAIACGPYLTLAQRTIPPGWSAARLAKADRPEWETALGLVPLAPSPPVYLPPGEVIPGGIRITSLGCAPNA
ncbi:histidine decarboxylase, pyruvoyl type [Rhizobium leguminosarum]|uniref:histidine decarboxylase, pyruvoyl type n=1 Tax=Rhizobium leguminosarum TaxID=384 RepID=UPI00104081D5|nr:histidine decarboxylase, pyruvoyl type [Rhizobium leguminosarum]MBY5345156.1 histidine decarboxylase [Rhizobium leguminosarum]MBY5391873.1 histidine decarboxylase [Rhizobium leguminosarum]MBY5434198.1 histidine decarboxylase [Rhizobium leguminosarum]NEK45876.1 histidine decarboxylase [Rhizobium leguminosarum]NKK53907.1 histidine decarboxylase [Rhizobium leguminosarum bv. viciae]